MLKSRISRSRLIGFGTNWRPTNSLLTDALSALQPALGVQVFKQEKCRNLASCFDRPTQHSTQRNEAVAIVLNSRKYSTREARSITKIQQMKTTLTLVTKSEQTQRWDAY